VAIPDIVECMRNSNQEVSNSVLELLSELVARSHLGDGMQIVTVFLLQSIQAHTLNVSTVLILYLSKFLDNALQDEHRGSN